MLQSALEHYRRQQRITTAGLAAARRARGTHRQLLAVVTLYQRTAALDAAQSIDKMLTEQGIDAPLDGQINTDRLGGVASDGRPLDSLLRIAQQESDTRFALLVATQFQDAARVAAGVSITARPKVIGYVRMLNPPSCARCVILAGKWFGWNAGFARHPLCDCRHIPTGENVRGDLRTDPDLAFRSGQVRGLTKAETRSLRDGADMAKVVNARRSVYMDPAGRKFTRESTTRRGSAPGIRPTPEAIYQTFGDDREAAIRALRKFAYII
jgi:hypothetical protein